MTGFLPIFAAKPRRRHCTSAIFAAAGLICAGCNGGSSTANQDDPADLPALSIANASVLEGDAGNSTLEFEVTLSAPASGAVTASYQTSDGTAVAGVDYVATNDTITFPSGSTTQTISIAVMGDTVVEVDETLMIALSNPSGATISQAAAAGTVLDDDAAGEPMISIENSSVSEGDAGVVTLVFDVTLSAAASGPVTVMYATSDDSAIAGADYISISGTVTFPAGVMMQTISIEIIDDNITETNETLILTLSSPIGATLERATAAGTIIDDDGASGIVFGLDTRPDNQTCIAPARPTADATVAVIDPFTGLPDIELPTKMLLEPVADPRWFVLQKSGLLVSFDPDIANSVTTYIDLSGVVRSAYEGGLLSMAFHPDYPNTPEIFLSYTIDHTGPAMRSVISRFILDNVTSPGAGTVEQVIMQLDQPTDVHQGGDIAFGPDGFLYIAFGDGGPGDDPNDRSQDTTWLLGSMVRIDVLGPGVSYPGNPYDIPADNPFAGNARCGPGANVNNCPEIYAWGFRNPWRWSFDPDTGDLWLGDVGQRLWEEVDLIELGGNYGWRCREGAHDFNTTGCGTGFIDPVAEFAHSLGRSITGGFVYRGVAIPELTGKYIFADYSTGQIWALQSDSADGYMKDLLIITNTGPTSFGVDQFGELYFTDLNNGRLRKIVPLPGSSSVDTIPTLLSDTGCTDPGDVTRPYPGLIPYDINAAFWSDGAVKDRYIGLPNGTTITRSADDDDWGFPQGTVIVKNFHLNGNLVETRHLMRHPDGVWAGYTYEWNSLQTEATRVKGGKTVSVAGQDWIFPAEVQCLQCHTNAADFALGLETAQLNRDFTYPSTQRTANQLDTLDHVLTFTTPLPGPASGQPVLTDPADVSVILGDRARAYLHTNCSQCHRPGGSTPVDMDLRYTTSLPNMNTCDVVPWNGDLGIANARLIAPGDASRSVVVNRASRRDSHGMPPLGSNLIDTVAVGLLSNWIDSLTGCN
jgi:uncharacterized repeat protein (TIGR03806 family)